MRPTVHIAWSLVGFVLASALPAPAAAQSEFEDAPQGYVRVDTNLHEHLFWLGATVPVGPLDLAADLILDGSALQADVGVAFHFANLSLLPMVGMAFDFDHDARHFDRLLVPRLFTVFEIGPLYFESWLQVTLRDALHSGRTDDFYTRDFLLLVTRYFAIGPQLELRYALAHNPGSGPINRAFGGQLASRWGASRFALFVGYDSAPAERDVVARFTFVRTWQ